MNPPYRARDRPLPADTPWLNNTLTLRKEMLLMKKFTKVIALILSLTLLLCFPTGVSAAEPEGTGADTAAKGSLTIYKVDLTSAEKDGAWDSSYVSTGVYDQNVNDTLTSYALKDVEFTYLRVADVVQVTESTADGGDFDHVETLYGISKTAGADLLNALGLGNGAKRYEKTDGSDQLDDSNYYYQSDTLISALSTALKANATTVKNALEAYVTESGTAMPLTDTYGKTRAEDLELGLYLVVETKVPEMVTSTCNPFFICLPMTSSGGSWIYDVTVYPKNLTGNPTLDKTLRECKDDTGKHNGSGSITDGYADTGTASDGDSVDYQIISTLPSITSASTYSVPFVGKHSKAWNRFKGKFLDSEENEYCVLDPRYNEVRDYLIDTYENAVKEWGIDGFKLDFIDSFRMTEFSNKYNSEMDTEQLEDAIEKLLSDVLKKLRDVNPDILIEFRQNYTGPLMQTYGNMLRASDCPLDALTNRVKTLDLRMMSGCGVVHSDMLMWDKSGLIPATR